MEQTPETENRRWFYALGKRELCFGAVLFVCALALCNFTFYGGFRLGFAIASVACILCAFIYLLCTGCRPSVYSCCMLLFSLVIAAGFGRSGDGFVKFVLCLFLILGVNLGLCLNAGQNRRVPGSVPALLDVPHAVFRLGCGRVAHVGGGLVDAFRKSGSFGRKGGAFLLGVVICLPLLAIMVSLLVKADAAFDGLVALLPDVKFGEIFVTFFFGIQLWAFLFTRNTALAHNPRAGIGEAKPHRGIPVITVNTVLCAVNAVYLVYLFSQLAYFGGGFAGILPEGYTLAEYARRGFFEMAALCAVNLTVMVLALGLVRKDPAAPLSTKLFCLFLALVTLFLVVSSGAKMVLYIDSFGLTRLRVLTMVILAFVALTTLVLSLWLFLPRLPYMKAILLIALALGAATLWADVNTVVAKYNVDAYLSGQLAHPDVQHLYSLGDAAIPQLVRLSKEAPDDSIQAKARGFLKMADVSQPEDFRSWDYVNHTANQALLPEEPQTPVDPV